jgi:predicted ABC-type ATPase
MALDELNLRAAKQIDGQVEQLISRGANFLVETVLSSDKYRDDVIAAKAAGYKMALVYISLHPPELSPQRVSERVRKNGHDVAYETALKRYHRSHQQLSWFAPRADVLYVFDNSAENGEPLAIAAKAETDAKVLRLLRINPAVEAALDAAGL